jgi:hypothetical protein
MFLRCDSKRPLGRQTTSELRQDRKVNVKSDPIQASDAKREHAHSDGASPRTERSSECSATRRTVRVHVGCCGSDLMERVDGRAADQLVVLSRMRLRGEITADEFAAAKRSCTTTRASDVAGSYATRRPPRLGSTLVSLPASPGIARKRRTPEQSSKAPNPLQTLGIRCPALGRCL